MEISTAPRKPVFATSLERVKLLGLRDEIRFLDLPYIAPAPHTWWDEVRRVFRILKAARTEDALLLNTALGGIQPDTLATAILGLMPKKRVPKVVLFGCMWQPNTGIRRFIDRLMVKLADRVVLRYIIQSTEELEVFPRLWGVDKSKMSLCLYCYSLSPEDLETPDPPPGDYVFAGGDSFRDYRAFIEAARRLPQHKFFIAARRHRLKNLPPNVTLQPVSHSQFMQKMRGALAVVTPLQQGLSRAAGQQTYLNAMYLRKPVIVSEGFAVRDHIEHGVDGMIVDGSVESYVETLQWMLDEKNANAVKCMAESAHRTAKRFNPQRNAEELVSLMIDALRNHSLACEQPTNPIG